MSLPLEVLLGKGTTDRRRPPFFKTKKVAILGATDALRYAPWDDPSWTLIAHPCCRKDCKREPDWYFDLHPRACFEHQRKRWQPKYFEWLTRLQTPVFMQENFPDIPAAVRFPRERITAEFRSYFTNHCAYMMALALTEGVTHLGLFGCQYATGGERSIQRESLLYWIGRIEQAGVRLVLPDRHNSLLVAPLYGYDSHDVVTGQLIGPYTPPRPTIVTPTGQPRTLVPLSDDPATRIPLMSPPEGEVIAWERSGLLVHA